MLNGADLAALIRADGNAELIQFQDSELSLGVYTLTTLLRGRRGTEVFTGGHAVGDLFVLLTGEGMTAPAAADWIASRTLCSTVRSVAAVSSGMRAPRS